MVDVHTWKHEFDRVWKPNACNDRRMLVGQKGCCCKGFDQVREHYRDPGIFRKVLLSKKILQHFQNNARNDRNDCMSIAVCGYTTIISLNTLQQVESVCLKLQNIS